MYLHEVEDQLPYPLRIVKDDTTRGIEEFCIIYHELEIAFNGDYRGVLIVVELLLDRVDRDWLLDSFIILRQFIWVWELEELGGYRSSTKLACQSVFCTLYVNVLARNIYVRLVLSIAKLLHNLRADLVHIRFRCGRMAGVLQVAHAR